MPEFRRRAGMIYGLLAVGLLLTGQNAAALHPGDHDDGLSRSATCAACVVVNLLSSACIDSAIAEDPQPLVSGVAPVRRIVPVSVAIRSPRQRAPPHA